MKTKGFILALALVAAATSSSVTTRAQNDAGSNLPPQIKQFANKIQTMNRSEISKLILNTWGPPTGDIGSGLHIPVWQLKEGQLTMNPLQGPSFKYQGKTVVLLKTKTKGKDCLSGSYQVLYSKDPGNQFWCGQIDLKSDGTYLYTQSGQKQVKFFATQEPRGKYKIKYQIDPQTDMASLVKSITIATLTLTSNDKKTQHYKINAQPGTRQFALSGNDLSDIMINMPWSI